jgi:REP element-mobilizing transposase RayT
MFNTEEPLAYFLTWTTYGTWLPGDERGWRRRGESDIQLPNRLFVEMARSRMKEPKFFLNDPARRVVEDTVRKHCAVRDWPLHAVNARTNHVHVVVTAVGYEPETARDQIKAWCTRRLKASETARTKFWTEGGNCRRIEEEADLETTVFYVIEAQDRKGIENG